MKKKQPRQGRGEESDRGNTDTPQKLSTHLSRKEKKKKKENSLELQWLSLELERWASEGVS